MTVLYLLEAVGLWAVVHNTFASSKLAATRNEVFFVKKIVRIICRFVCILHYVFQFYYFSGLFLFLARKKMHQK